MAETSIQWCDYTFNPWIGCQRVSPGCEHCYAEVQDSRGRWGGGEKHWGPKAPRHRTSVSTWRNPLTWNRKAQATGKRARVFCASLADVFEDREELVPWREDLFGLIAATQNLDWLLLTKRPENIGRLWPKMKRAPDNSSYIPAWEPGAERWPNVWLGTTVEDQRRAEERIPHLVAVPAVVRFLSCEPLLGPLNLSKWMDEDELGFVNSPIDWVIIGGESGAGARPFDLAWARSLVWQCRNGGRSIQPTPFVKQLGACASDPVNGIAGAHLRVHSDAEALISRRLRDSHGGDPAEWPLDLRVREFPEVRR
jgi:protein gp37